MVVTTPAFVCRHRALDRGPGFRFLRFVLQEDRRAILGADIIALAVELGGVVGPRRRCRAGHRSRSGRDRK